MALQHAHPLARAVPGPAPRSVRCRGTTPGSSPPRFATPSARLQSPARCCTPTGRGGSNKVANANGTEDIVGRRAQIAPNDLPELPPAIVAGQQYHYGLPVKGGQLQDAAARSISTPLDGTFPGCGSSVRRGNGSVPFFGTGPNAINGWLSLSARDV